MNFYDYLKDNLNIDVKDQELLQLALTHPSYANEINNPTSHYERLEFVGDAILQYIISEYIYLEYPEMDEGNMTVLRAKAVREGSLASYANKYHIGDYILVGRGERMNNGMYKKSVLANVFESVLGAIYLSNGMEDAKKFIEISKIAIKDNDFEDLEDYKTKLQEYVQADQKKTVNYELVDVKGPSNKPHFYIKVMMNDLVLGTGDGSSKKIAQQNAAKNALEKMVAKNKE